MKNKNYLVMLERAKDKAYKRGHNTHTNQSAKRVKHVTILNKCRKIFP